MEKQSSQMPCVWDEVDSSQRNSVSRPNTNPKINVRFLYNILCQPVHII